MQFVDQHPKLVKYGLAISAMVVTFSFLMPVLLGVASAIGAVGTAFTILTGIVTGAIPVYGGIALLLGTISWPIYLLGAAIAALAVIWALNLGDIRGKTEWFVEGMVRAFFVLVDWIGKSADMVIDAMNKVREGLGMEAIDYEYHPDRAFKAYQKFKNDMKSEFEDFSVADMFGVDAIDMDGLTTVDEYTGMLAENAAEYADNMERANAANAEIAATSFGYEGAAGTRRGAAYRREHDPDWDEAAYEARTSTMREAKAAAGVAPGTVYSMNINVENMNTNAENEDELGEIVITSVKGSK